MSEMNPPIDNSSPDDELDDLDDLPYLDPKTAPVLTLAVRAKASGWDRSKILVALVALWWLLLWTDLANNPIESFSTAASLQLSSLWWVEALIGLEILRQIHYLISERSPRWHRAWTQGFFALPERMTRSTSDWTRYRMSRVIRLLVVLVVLALLLAAFFHVSPAASLFLVPSALFSALPFILQLAFGFFFVIFQFVGIFWFLSRGGIDVYFPGDVRTRFADVWGQDAVLERVKENIIFLKDPESIESRGGFVPGGILLWGPPGTGKTLIAEAVAGETENPFVFVDPGAFINMFMGIGILKVKSLFRKLRKLAVRYGGVVVFFDEADSLGNRGSLALGGVFGPKPASAWSHEVCHGMNYVSEPSAFQMFKDSLASTTPDPRPTRIGMMMGGMMGGGGMGTLQSLLAELSGLSKPRGFMNRVVRRGLGLAAKQRKALGPPEEVEYIGRERHAVAVHEACHALAAAKLRKDRAIDVATIEKGGTYLGFVSSVRFDDTFTTWRSDFEADIMVSLASLAGERLFFDGDNSSGVSGDLESATRIASYTEGYWGMGRTVASVGIAREIGTGPSGPSRERTGEGFASSISERVEDKLADLLERTKELLEAHRGDVLAIAHALELHKTITGEDVLAILDGTQGALLDGRQYHSPEFRARAEEYH